MSVEERLGVAGRQTMSNFFGEGTKGIDVMENRFMQKTINLSNDPTDVEDRLQALVVMKRVRINEFFHDFDKLRKGWVTRSQFSAILSTLGFDLTDEEFSSLADKYKAMDSMVDYRSFCRRINSAFTIEGLEWEPTTIVKKADAHDKDATEKARKKMLDFNEQE